MHAQATKPTKGSKFSIRALLLKQGGPTRRQYSFHPTHSVLHRCVREWGCVYTSYTMCVCCMNIEHTDSVCAGVNLTNESLNNYY